MSDIEFVDGLIAKEPHAKAPDFVKCAISIKREDLISWLSSRDGDWINVDVKESKGGKWYAAVNDFTPDSGFKSQAKEPELNDDIPF